MTTLINPNNPGMSMNEQEQMRQLQQLLRTSESMKCEKCENLNFINVYRIKKISGLMSGTGRDMIVPVSVYACSDCGHVNEYFLSKLSDEDTEEEGQQ